MAYNQNQFNTRNQAQNKRNHSWCCLSCGSIYATKPVKECTFCHKDSIHYFPSQAELRRFGQLRLLTKLGKIKDLELQPVYEIYGKKSGLKLMEYRADFRYFDVASQQTVVEDVKGTTNEKYLDPVFKIKRRATEGEYKIKIKVIKA